MFGGSIDRHFNIFNLVPLFVELMTHLYCAPIAEMPETGFNMVFGWLQVEILPLRRTSGLEKSTQWIENNGWTRYPYTQPQESLLKIKRLPERLSWTVEPGKHDNCVVQHISSRMWTNKVPICAFSTLPRQAVIILDIIQIANPRVSSEMAEIELVSPQLSRPLISTESSQAKYILLTILTAHYTSNWTRPLPKSELICAAGDFWSHRKRACCTLCAQLTVHYPCVWSRSCDCRHCSLSYELSLCVEEVTKFTYIQLDWRTFTEYDNIYI
jgi:hypothetical protein